MKTAWTCTAAGLLLLIASLSSRAADAPAPNTLTPAERADGWQLLFDGASLTNWCPYGSPEGAIADGWAIENGQLHKVGGRKGGDIVTRRTYNDFELSWEWRLAPGGNNGVKYLVTTQRPKAPGHEYQMLDDVSPRHAKVPDKERTASFYGVLPPAADKPLRPAGEWNASRIVVSGQRVEHWLNGSKVLEYELGSAPVKAAVAQSKFRPFPEFGDKIAGHIMLTDHGDDAWYRNVKIRQR